MNNTALAPMRPAKEGQQQKTALRFEIAAVLEFVTEEKRRTQNEQKCTKEDLVALMLWWSQGPMRKVREDFK